MVENTCIENVRHYWEYSLPDVLTPHSLYFIKTQSGVSLYVTDANSVSYLVSGGSQGGDITLTSPNGTITIDQYAIDINASILETIVYLHNNFPDLQGGQVGEYYHLKLSEYTRLKALIYQNNTSSIAIVPVTGERGFSTPIMVYYSIDPKDDIFTSATINNGIGSVFSHIGQGTQTVSGGNVVSGTTYVLTLGYTRNGAPTTEVKVVSYTPYLPQWKGISAIATLNTANYTTISANLSKVIQPVSSPANPLSIDILPTSQYIWFFSTDPNAIIKNNGYNLTIGAWGDTTAFFWKQNITLTLADGTTTASLTAYRTRDTATFTTTQNYTLT